MKLIANLPRVAVLLGLLLLSFGGFAQAEQADEMWYRRKFSLQLKSDQTFTTTDTSLTKIGKSNLVRSYFLMPKTLP